MKERIKKIIGESLEVKKGILDACVDDVAGAAGLMINALRNGKKLVVFGNGGSAADSQHLAGELVGRFEKERRALPAIALTTNTSTITAVGNDYSFERTFARQVEAVVSEGDVVIGISTSGNASNVMEALKQAGKQKALTIGMTGKTGGRLKGLVDTCLCVPSENTARVQEGHILLIHILCKLIEDEVFK